jgi:hypothetical protein
MCYVVLLIFHRVLVHEIVLLQGRYRAAVKGSSSLFAHALAQDSKRTAANKSTEKTSQDSPIAQLLKGIFSTNH